MTWEYLVVSLFVSDIEKKLNSLGAQGWELVAIMEKLVFLKRPKGREL